eukprot:TRINITY_DN75527_c0_g1_i1.p1 TRINITY_DN75527_c0_g1~~TRINITY_DN75527_c0_g1_i1.p1  ORF type:complete len:272 (-),score=31.41 TRINITY_DN75527_c0_g1_i1:125-853(-)
MAYGPLCQCAFMSYGPRIQQKAPPKKGTCHLWDKLPAFQPPQGCEAPPPGAFTMLSCDVAEAKLDPTHATRSMELDSSCVVFGSSQDYDGQVHDGHKTVADQHASIYFKKGKWYLKAINGVTHLESMTLHPYLRDIEGRPLKRYLSSNNKKIDSIMPMDGKRMLSRELCVIRLGDSDRRYWVMGALPFREGEYEEDATDARDKKRERERHEKDPKEKEKERKRRGRDKSFSRSRSRSYKRRR